MRWTSSFHRICGTPSAVSDVRLEEEEAAAASRAVEAISTERTRAPTLLHGEHRAHGVAHERARLRLVGRPHRGVLQQSLHHVLQRLGPRLVVGARVVRVVRAQPDQEVDARRLRLRRRLVGAGLARERQARLERAQDRPRRARQLTVLAPQAASERQVDAAARAAGGGLDERGDQLRQGLGVAHERHGLQEEAQLLCQPVCRLGGRRRTTDVLHLLIVVAVLLLLATAFLPGRGDCITRAHPGGERLAQFVQGERVEEARCAVAQAAERNEEGGRGGAGNFGVLTRQQRNGEPEESYHVRALQPGGATHCRQLLDEGAQAGGRHRRSQLEEIHARRRVALSAHPLVEC
eukprot:scaffold28750_cov51-Phaeocystis_antarctica.AAC.3